MGKLENLRRVLDTGDGQSLIRSLGASTVLGANIEAGPTSLRDYIGPSETATIQIGDKRIRTLAVSDVENAAPQSTEPGQPANSVVDGRPMHSCESCHWRRLVERL